MTSPSFDWFDPDPKSLYKYIFFFILSHLNMEQGRQRQQRGVTWIHLRYGIDVRMQIEEFDSRHFITVREVLERVKHKFKNCNINLYNEHNIQLKFDHIIEKGRVYIVKRKPS